MREIKFRAWNEENSIMMDPSRNMLIDSYDGVPNWGFGYDELIPQNWIVMQYTGLKDKNGKEIYEGDMLRLARAEVQKVEWCDDDAMFQLVPGRCGDPLYCSKRIIDFEQGEVIGNIHENPELLGSMTI